METFMERVCEKKTLDEIQYEDMFARYNCISRDAQLCLKKKKIFISCIGSLLCHAMPDIKSLFREFFTNLSFYNLLSINWVFFCLWNCYYTWMPNNKQILVYIFLLVNKKNVYVNLYTKEYRKMSWHCASIEFCHHYLIISVRLHYTCNTKYELKNISKWTPNKQNWFATMRFNRSSELVYIIFI